MVCGKKFSDGFSWRLRARCLKLCPVVNTIELYTSTPVLVTGLSSGYSGGVKKVKGQVAYFSVSSYMIGSGSNFAWLLQVP